jgi:hypothetical protein
MTNPVRDETREQEGTEPPRAEYALPDRDGLARHDGQRKPMTPATTAVRKYCGEQFRSLNRNECQ